MEMIHGQEGKFYAQIMVLFNKNIEDYIEWDAGPKHSGYHVRFNVKPGVPITLQALVDLSVILGTESINFTTAMEEQQLSSYTYDPATPSFVMAWNVKVES